MDEYTTESSQVNNMLCFNCVLQTTECTFWSCLSLAIAVCSGGARVFAAYYCTFNFVLLYVLCIALSHMYRPIGYWAIFSNPAVQLFSCKYATIKLSWVEFVAALAPAIRSPVDILIMVTTMTLVWTVKSTRIRPAMQTPIRQKRPNFRIPYFCPSKRRPLHSAGSDAPLRPPPSRRHWLYVLLSVLIDRAHHWL